MRNHALKRPTGQIRSSREWYQWIGIGEDTLCYRFFFFFFDVEFLKGVQSSEAFTAQIYLITVRMVCEVGKYISFPVL
jgi:hypothetical protein